jgi:hypothetical protein
VAHSFKVAKPTFREGTEENQVHGSRLQPLLSCSHALMPSGLDVSQGFTFISSSCYAAEIVFLKVYQVLLGHAAFHRYIRDSVVV